eukprot:1187573-Prorocentrum_minimum.AAC.2
MVRRIHILFTSCDRKWNNQVFYFYGGGWCSPGGGVWLDPTPGWRGSAGRRRLGYPGTAPAAPPPRQGSPRSPSPRVTTP